MNVLPDDTIPTAIKNHVVEGYLLTQRKVHDILPSEKSKLQEKYTQDSFQTTEYPEQPHPFLNRTVPRLLRSYYLSLDLLKAGTFGHFWNQKDCVFWKFLNIERP